MAFETVHIRVQITCAQRQSGQNRRELVARVADTLDNYSITGIYRMPDVMRHSVSLLRGKQNRKSVWKRRKRIRKS